jgi:enoyl-CoA hydratase/carnithine racemase
MTKELVLTCRQFTPQEAKTMGFVNSVVSPADLERHTAELPARIAAMPAVPAAITKQQVNAVTQMMAGSTAYADGDLLLGAHESPESLEVRKAYVERRLNANKGD